MILKKCAESGCENMLPKSSRKYCSVHNQPNARSYQFGTKSGYRFELKEQGISLIALVYHRNHLIATEFYEPEKNKSRSRRFD